MRSKKEKGGLVVLQTIGKEKLNRVKELCYFKKLKLKYQVAWHDVVTL